MKISALSIEEIASILRDKKSGKELVKLFNKYGFRDIYDEQGLPDIGKKTGQRPSKIEYASKRLSELNGKSELRYLIEDVVNNNKDIVSTINEIIENDGFACEKLEDKWFIKGGVIENKKPIVNEAYFDSIQNQILAELDKAKVSIKAVLAWFTNETLLNKLIEKQNEGLDVSVIIYDDGVNKKHGVDLSKLKDTHKVKGSRGGIMHDKFCVIDNQKVITGSYNWTNNAEHKNDENITIFDDPKSATKYSVQYRELLRNK